MSEAWIGLIAAVITGTFSLIGVYIANRKSQTLIAYRIEQLEKTVNKHNQVADRVSGLEGRMTEAEHNIQDIKKKVG